jgi:heptose-I-phosphate ethanolaminephosphotransferase
LVEERTRKDFAVCDKLLLSTQKDWKKAINTVEKMHHLDASVAGFEMDVYFDTSTNCLHVYHDSSGFSTLRIELVLNEYKTRNLSSALWLDFKNLSSVNEKPALHYISALRNKYNLKDKLIIESSSPRYLQSFCDSGFFTSYYVPFFNPYLMSKKDLLLQLESIGQELNKYSVSALSGYYFQYPVLKNYFPNFPILTWTDNSGLSLITNSFNRRLLNDPRVKVLLYP